MPDTTADTTPGVRLVRDDRGAHGVVATLVVDNPRKLNVMNTGMIQSFLEQAAAVREESRLRVVVVTGAGQRAFVGGADIAEMATLDKASARKFITGIHEVCDAIRSLPVPVIGRIDGYCYGAGLEMAAACDMRVATERSVFGMPEVRVGVPSVVEAALLPGLIGWGKTHELLYTGMDMDAEQAYQCGFVERIVSPETLDAAVEMWVSAVLDSAPSAVRLQKELVREWERLALPDAIHRGIDYFERSFETEEPREYMGRFLNRKR